MITVIGAGLAGCECAYRLAESGFEVTLREMKPERFSPAHKSGKFAELVCSNSLKGDAPHQASGLLKAEMRMCGSPVIRAADASRVGAGGALAVDRELFSEYVTREINAHPGITVERGEVTRIPDGEVVIAAGPLVSDALAEELKLLTGAEFLSFYDAAAPIISRACVDMSVAYAADRYGAEGGGDYINCPMDKERFAAFREALANAEEAPVRGFEDKRVFEGCMPAEVLARRGEDTLRFGPLKPVGLRDPRTGKGAYAVVQLRRENAAGDAYNMVGFQTHLKFPEQRRVFSMIPGLENIEILRYGVMHRNTFINSPELLGADYALKAHPRIRFAGQITGVEGYVESAASGLLTALSITGKTPPPFDTALGALSRHITHYGGERFQPMNFNFGLLPPPDVKTKTKTEKFTLMSERALNSLREWRKHI